MLKFDMVNRKVAIDPKSLLIEALRNIWENDKSKSKETATKQLSYVHLVSQIDETAPYFSASHDEVEALVKRDIFGNYEHAFSAEDQEIIDDAIDQYRKAYESEAHRVVRIFTMKIDQIRSLIENTAPVITPSVSRGVVSYASNFAGDYSAHGYQRRA
jgi:hypothetical protein